MCFSAEASFAAAAMLAPMGAYCLRASARRLSRFLLFAAIPLGFALQQASEGMVWLGLEHGRSAWVKPAAAVYLFFALAWWPFWFPLAAAYAARRPRPRRVLVGWSILATGWFFLAYLPIVLEPSTRLAVEISHHSLRYPFADDYVFGPEVRWPATALYALFCAGPLLVLARRDLLFPVVLGPICFALAQLAYHYAYTSVWCFFAAFLSAYSVYFFRTAPDEPVTA